MPHVMTKEDLGMFSNQPQTLLELHCRIMNIVYYVSLCRQNSARSIFDTCKTVRSLAPAYSLKCSRIVQEAMLQPCFEISFPVHLCRSS